MFPIRDHNPSEKTPFVTWALIALNVAIHLWAISAAAGPAELYRLWYAYGLVPAELSRGQGLWSLVTSMFLHGGLLHLGGNMLFLWIFGDNLEEELGHGGFLLFYLASGVGAALAQWLAAPFSTVPMIGASGAIAGVMGGYLLLFPRARVDVLIFIVIIIRIIPVPAWLVLLAWLGIQVAQGAVADAQGGGVAYWAHAGGFVVGFALVLPVWLAKGGPGYWRRTDGHPPHPEARWGPLEQSRVPRVRRR
ncbi:rhomboid family intramembrane serine protease [Rubellimicrobium sp. CFH 75288]|uniref:rhomboid family intramembrane serine protease n=1 Tax=Rubellimicrobium sp. CFH 75288 TaxID=2697034 RepID=UPI0014129881|nr:rhomboid family intramembrane serine protease [Rubellimicrobium sp. CFH 75288]NAZ38322.1 rhomboid family intramembrane serine protease [Rubellimicrobium sp. CFH 75288]